MGCEAQLSSSSGNSGVVVLGADAGMGAPPRMGDGGEAGPLPDAGEPRDAGLSDVGEPVEDSGGLPPRDMAVQPVDAAPPPIDVPPLPIDAALPADRADDQQVCARWRAERRSVGNEWAPTPGSQDPCDPGTLTDEAQANAIRRTNLYRWLAGLEPVELNAGLRAQQQACAAIMNGINGITHQPAPNSACYTAEGAAGAGSSNLVAGTNAADSVDLYVGDRGVASLGHRRWVLNPSAANTTFGHKGRFGCMYSFSRERRHDVEFVAWPPPGPLPVQAAQGTWHISLYGRRAQQASVSMSIDGGPFEAVQAGQLPGNYGGQAQAFVWSAPQGVWAAGRQARVRVSGLQGEDIEYGVRFIDCR